MKSPSKDMVNSAPFLQPIVSETCEKTKKVPGKKRQHPAEPKREEESANVVMQIIKSIRTVRRTPQEILAAYNSSHSEAPDNKKQKVERKPKASGASPPTVQ